MLWELIILQKTSSFLHPRKKHTEHTTFKFISTLTFDFSPSPGKDFGDKRSALLFKRECFKGKWMEYISVCKTGILKIPDYYLVKELLLTQFIAAAEQVKSNRQAGTLRPL